ncbi:gamma-glutamyl-gamma-aminobutyrate hydrolase family protein [Carboxydochorda subterranea]|uniref:Gamma-glutamyl-gamma-aminobutyrate hydrolase family protein n=1 Tax=Carboxydichorda subterranea TaxID=3109565 RepID=A0ABZ1BZ59_9FIRM|nr:gamma-glutamyl-gamma-aminobutyrate hydrolase family protein [Limnochorda sp. L945t]WRP18021.1 gamma-glutamyl-gamma-aminobutyrate hydrolase family protein [Limnochorda sp. L945t]
MESAGGQRPVIGISAGQLRSKDGTLRASLSRDYVRAVEMAGGLPVLIPVTDDPQLAAAYLDNLDALLLSGGGDVDPHRFGEDAMPELGEVDPERDALEVALAAGAMQRDMPLLGICRGIQVMNVAAGGTLYQDVRAQVPHALLHDQTAPRWFPCHEVRLEPDSLLRQIFQADTLRVNSFHHQAVRVVAPTFRVAAKAKDAVIEGVESREHGFCVGVQWHPECMVDRYPGQRLLFAALVRAARTYRERRASAGVVSGPAPVAGRVAMAARG